MAAGRQSPWLLLAVLWFAVPALAQSKDDGFLTAIGGLREASFPDKEAAVEVLREIFGPASDLPAPLPVERVFAAELAAEKMTSPHIRP